MKVSIYYFNDLERSYGIIQFEGNEVGTLRKKLDALKLDEFLDIMKKSLGLEPVSVSLAKGKYTRRGTVIDMVYLRIELEETIYTFEIYDESMEVISSDDMLNTLNFVKEFVKVFVPHIIERKHGWIGL